MIAPGSTLGNYRIERQLGEGGMGTVWLATHTALGSRHAIKILDAHLMASDKVRDRFVAEGRIQAQLAHPSIVRVSDILSEPGVAGLVMDYIEGPSLDAWIQERGRPAAPGDIRALFLPLVSAVGAVHAKGIIHRDLKPSNVLVADGPRPVLVDFGIARLTDHADIDHTPKRRTRTGVQLGTAGYMSPEQIQGASDLDQRADIFALGAILYELVTGHGAFDAGSEFEVMRKVVDGDWAPVASTPGALAQLEPVIARALATDRSDRYADCAALAKATEAALAGGAPLASPSDDDEEPRRSWLAPIVAAVIVFALIVGGYLALRSDPPPRSPVVTAPTPSATPAPAPQAASQAVPQKPPGMTLSFPTPAEPTPAPEPPTAPVVVEPPTPTGYQGPRHRTPSWIVMAGSYVTDSEAGRRASELRRLGFDAAVLWIPDYGSLSGSKRWAAFVGPAVSERDGRRLLRELQRFQHDAYGLRLDREARRATLKAGSPPRPPKSPARTSYDCRKARTEVEVAVCSDVVLAGLDQRMAKAYFAARDRLTGKRREGLVKEQKSFLGTRDRCARKVAMNSCLKSVYQDRIDALNRVLRQR